MAEADKFVPERVTMIVGRPDVESGDISGVANALAHLLRTEDSIATLREQVTIAFDGYNDDPRDLWDIEDVRHFVADLDEVFPYWFYFLEKQTLGLWAVIMCFVPAGLPENDRQIALLKRLVATWMPAADRMCERAGLTETERRDLEVRAALYLGFGPS